jgi:poly(3-hydroxybutyrate) depolymerase
MADIAALGATQAAGARKHDVRHAGTSERVSRQDDRYAAEPPIVTGTYNAFLYPLTEMQRLGRKMWFNPMATWLSTQSAMVSMAQSCKLVPKIFTPYAELATDVLDASATMAERAGRDYQTKPAFNLNETTIAGKVVGVREEVALERPFGNLLHFKRDTHRNDPKLLLVAPMSGHYATLLRDTVASLLPHHDLYITDWKNARDIPLSEGDFGLDDYIDYVKEFINQVGPGSHVMAVCQPTVATLAAVSELAREKSPNQPLSMTLMAGPLDVRAAATKVTEYASSRPIDWFERNVVSEVPFGYAGAGRKVYQGEVQLASFMGMNLGHHIKSHIDMFNHLMNGNTDKADKLQKFYDEYLTACDLPARFYLETVQRVFIDPELAQGKLRHHGQLVDPSQIHGTALFTVEGEKDDISAPGQTTVAHRLCSGLNADQKFHYLQPGAGHYGVFSGSSYRAFIAPRITGFIRDTAMRHGLRHDQADGQMVPAVLVNQ